MNVSQPSTPLQPYVSSATPVFLQISNMSLPYRPKNAVPRPAQAYDAKGKFPLTPGTPSVSKLVAEFEAKKAGVLPPARFLPRTPTSARGYSGTPLPARAGIGRERSETPLSARSELSRGSPMTPLPKRQEVRSLDDINLDDLFSISDWEKLSG